MQLSCKHSCRSEGLPQIFLTISRENAPTYVRVFNEYADFTIGENFQWKLPFTLSSDTTTFYFQRAEGGTDTLSIRYKRSTVLEDTGCGLYFTITEPELLPATSFDSVELYNTELYLDVWL